MDKNSQKKKLEKDALKASRIQQTLSTNGWKDILEIFQSEYDSSMNVLLEKENPEARGAINIITKIMDSISQDLKFGEAAQKKYKEKYLTNRE